MKLTLRLFHFLFSKDSRRLQVGSYMKIMFLKAVWVLGQSFSAKSMLPEVVQNINQSNHGALDGLSNSTSVKHGCTMFQILYEKLH